jgi:hypothetical protein
MKKVINFIGILTVCALFMLTFSCQNPESSAADNGVNPSGLAGENLSADTNPTTNTITDIGQVSYINLEGGFWGIVGSKGNYDPINLPKEFCVEGLWVIFQAQPLYDTASIHMWGTLISITRIEKLSGKIISDIGTVRQSGIQGKPFIIEGTKGTYQPINLPAKYQIIGLKVKFTARLRTDIVIIPKVWPLIEILTISVVSDPVYFNLGSKFQLPVTCTAIGRDAKISLIFEKVVSDNRCPSDVSCIVAGKAVISVNIAIGDVNYGSFLLSTEPNAGIVEVGSFKFSLLALDPYPATSIATPPVYVATFVVESLIQPINFRLGEEFKLPVTQTAIDPTEKIVFRFDQVVSDSRCPQNVECFWAGEAIILVDIAINGIEYGSFKMSSLPSSNNIIVGRYSFTFVDLYPLPIAGTDIASTGYIGYFIVNNAITTGTVSMGPVRNLRG